jgi:hypothetical protein
MIKLNCQDRKVCRTQVKQYHKLNHLRDSFQKIGHMLGKLLSLSGYVLRHNRAKLKPVFRQSLLYSASLYDAHSSKLHI